MIRKEVQMLMWIAYELGQIYTMSMWELLLQGQAFSTSRPFDIA